MNTKTTTENPEINNSERIIALLGVAAHQQKSKTGACPSEEQLAAFISGTGKRRKTMLAHLNRCPKCYHHWLDTASYVKSLKPEKPNFFLKKLDFLRDVFHLDNWKPLVSVTVTAVLVVAVLILFFQPIKSPIDASYAAVTAHNPDGLSQVLEELPLETITLGFYEVESSPPAQAFAAGIETGQAVLTNTTPSDDWADSQWADEYTLGRWFVLLWTVAQIPNQAPIDFWTLQPAIGEKLQARFSFINKRSPDDMTKTVLETLATIQPLLIELKNQPNNRGVAYRLSHQLEMAMNGISEL